MPTLFIPHQMRELTGGRDRIEIPAGTLRQAIRSLEAEYPELVARIRVDDALAPGLSAAIDSAIAPRGLLAKIGPSSEVHLIPAVGGG
jgi:molybdopterin converting factor small subunit